MENLGNFSSDSAEYSEIIDFVNKKPGLRCDDLLNAPFYRSLIFMINGKGYLIVAAS